MGTGIGIIIGIVIGIVLAYLFLNSSQHASTINYGVNNASSQLNVGSNQSANTQTSISDILANSNSFMNKTVSVEGELQFSGDCGLALLNFKLVDVNTGKYICVNASDTLANDWNDKTATILGIVNEYHGAGGSSGVVLNLEQIS